MSTDNGVWEDASHQLIRDDIREDIPGVELLIALEVIDIKTCEPVPDVMVDFWHCTNDGEYIFSRHSQ